ncbi:PREDICTED: uncharacterized protein LOC109326413 [Lupinus angustifolius]|uniref:uncharacterized protein LOC109326413 n=1 Tax=Lupinus angustifolius TaxID=3871 RepID=UPI00092EE96E|nr:PREDICTED: uncharacterized protein LOC109326413 [Lupinus angustifolius]
MEENDKVGYYFTKVITITNQMKGCGEVVTDLMIIEKIMIFLPQNFDYIVVAIEESKNVSIMRIEELQSSLEAHEMRLMDKNPIKGYYSYVCSVEKGKQKNLHDKEAFTTHEDPEVESLTLMVTNSAEDAYLESCTLKVEGAGDVVIMRNNGSKALISDVLFVPGMKYNLLSIGKLIQKGFTTVMGNRQVEVFDVEKRLILRSKLTKNMTFQVNIKAVNAQCLTTIEANEDSWLWHSRYGHLNFRSLY